MQKQILLLSIVALLFASCAATKHTSPSKHPGIAYVKKPAETEKDENAWFAYYQDQFDANEGRVAMPQPEAPLVQRETYVRAKKEWEDKLAKYQTGEVVKGTAGNIVLTTILGLVVLYLVVAVL